MLLYRKLITPNIIVRVNVKVKDQSSNEVTR